jgi:RNA methyltransferase, TrmH family
MRELGITSKANPRVRFYRGLDDRAARRESGCMAAEGVRLVLEALRSGIPVTELFLSDTLDGGGEREIMERAAERDRAGLTLYRLPEAIFRSMAHTRNPQGAAAVVRIPDGAPDPAGWRRIVILHSPRDPGNVGTILRSAEAAGFDGLVMTGEACDPYGPKAVRASMGSVFRVPVAVRGSLGEVMRELSPAGIRLLAAVPRAPRSLYDIDCSPPLAVILGGETAGLPPLPGGQVEPFSIPMQGRVESLNLAQAATLVLYELGIKNVKLGSAPEN